MAKGDPNYARLEVDFMRSLEWLSLPAGARILYLSLWCYALGQRKETIVNPGYDVLASLSGLRRHPVRKYVESLSSPPHNLIKLYDGDRYIHLTGIYKKHLKFQWSESPYGEYRTPTGGTTGARKSRVQESRVQESTVELSPEPPKKVTPDLIPIITIPITKKREYPITQYDIDEWSEAYPAVDIIQTLRNIRQWNIANPKKVKTERGVRGHITGWLAREQDKPRVQARGTNKAEQRNQSNLSQAQEWLDEQIRQDEIHASNDGPMRGDSNRSG